MFVDALDECGKGNAINLVSKFLALYQNCESARSQLHICFTCRHYPILDSHCEFEICTEDENRDDISIFVNSQLSGLCGHMSTTIPDLITTRANGIFMWARLVVQQVLNLDREGEGLHVIEAKIGSIPQDLDELYQGLIRTMETPSLELIQWICFATRPLSLKELRWALALDANLPNRSLQEFQISSDNPDDDRLERRVRTLSCGLAEVVSSSYPVVVQFIHQSVKEFFVEKGLSILDRATGSRDAIASAHYRLATSCIYYLSMKEFVSSTESELDCKESRFPFLRYATTSWVTHARESDKGFVPPEYLLKLLAGQSNSLMERWVRIYGVLERESTIDNISDDLPPSGTILEHVMSRYEMKRLWRAALERRDQIDININAKDSQGRTPLSWAASAGHKSIVQLLLEKGAQIEAADKPFGRTPLLWAARSGHEDVVRMLLSQGAKIEAMDKEGQTALLTAVTAGKEAAVLALLNCGARIEVADRSEGETSLWRAVAGGHEALVKMLLDRGARMEATDKRYGQTPLWRAATAGHEAIVRMLLDRGARIEATDKRYGQTPLWRAAAEGHEAIVKMLLDRGAHIDAADKYFGQTPFWRAIEAGHEAVVQQLLEHGANIEAMQGNSQASLPWLKRLLRKKAEAEVDPHYSLTPLCRAAKAGSEAIVRLLLDRGANIETADEAGRTPLSWAATCEVTTILQLLLARGADIESKDKKGQTPLFWAASSGYEKNTRLLLDSGANIESENIYGSTPLVRAIWGHHEAIVQLLRGENADIKVEDEDDEMWQSFTDSDEYPDLTDLLNSNPKVNQKVIPAVGKWKFWKTCADNFSLRLLIWLILASLLLQGIRISSYHALRLIGAPSSQSPSVETTAQS